MPDVVIVGGGPVGLYLAALLLQEGVEVRVLEQLLHWNSGSGVNSIPVPSASTRLLLRPWPKWAWPAPWWGPACRSAVELP